MARPKLGESDTERLHVKITADEVKAIDDWRYANRVPSRSEAVRRLVQMGMVCHSPVTTTADAVLDVYEQTTVHYNKLLSVANDAASSTVEDLLEALEDLLLDAMTIHEKVELIQLATRDTANQIEALSDGATVTAAIELAAAQRAAAAKFATKLKRRQAMRRKS